MYIEWEIVDTEEKREIDIQKEKEDKCKLTDKQTDRERESLLPVMQSR